MDLVAQIRKRSIAIRFLLIIALGLVIGQFGFSYYTISSNSQTGRNGLRHKAESQAKVLAAISPEYLFSNNFLPLENLIKQITEDREIIYIFLFAPDGRPLTNHINRNDRYIRSALESSNKTLVELTQEISSDPEVFVVTQPIVFDSEVIGEVQLAYTIRSLNKRIWDSVIRTAVFFVLLVLSLFALTYYQFKKQVQKPLKNLGEITNQFASGEFDIRSPLDGGKEIFHLQKSFNRMADHIQSNLKELEKFTYAVAHTDNLVVICNAEAQIDWVNNAFIKTTGYSFEEVKGKTPGSFLQGRDTDPKVVEYIRAQIKERKPFECVILNYTKSGGEYWVSIECSPVFDDKGELINFVAIERDITNKREAELALIKAKNTAEATTQAKTNFLTNLSHEIRTPMNGIMGVTELLNETSLDEEQVSYVEIIEESSDRLLAIIENILDFSHVENDSFEIEPRPFNLVELVQSIVDQYEDFALNKNIAISFQPSAAVMALADIKSDPDLLGKAIGHLLDNAVRFTPKGAIAVTLTAERYPLNQAEYKIDVIDTGIGVQKDQLSKIFDSFTQVDGSLTRQHQGSGLGLTICKGIAQTLSGDLTVQSEVGMGSTFSFSFNAPLVQAKNKKSDPEVA